MGTHAKLRLWERHQEREGRVSLSEGSLSVVQGCWTNFGNHLQPVGDREVDFRASTTSIEGAEKLGFPTGMQTLPTQPFIVEVSAPRSARVSIDADPFDVSFSVEDALMGTQIWADVKGCQRLVEKEFGLSAGDIENPDVYYHNAYKLRVLQAVPESAFRTEVEFSDPDPPAGRN